MGESETGRNGERKRNGVFLRAANDEGVGWVKVEHYSTSTKLHRRMNDNVSVESQI